MRTGVVLGFIVVVLAGGCLSPTPETTPTDPPVTDDALAFLPPREIATYSNMEVESFIQVSADAQTMLTCLHGEFTRPSYMFASIDGGETFEELEAFPPPGVGGDCYVARSGSDAWSFVHSTGFGTTVATTTDQGRSWIVNPAAAHPTNGFADRPWLTFHEERLLLAYMPLIWEPGGIGFTRSEDYGRTWTVSETIVPLDAEYPYIRHGDFLHGPDGTLRIPFVRAQSSNAGENQGPMRLAFAVSRDGGATWAEEPVAEITAAAATSTGAAQGSDGSLFWPYYVGGSGGHELRILVSVDDGQSWTDHLAAKNLSAARVWWGDGRPGASADFTFLADGAHVSQDNPYVAVLRVTLHEGVLNSEMAALREQTAALEYVGLDHDENGRAFAVITEPGFQVTTTGHLFLVAEDER